MERKDYTNDIKNRRSLFFTFSRFMILPEPCGAEQFQSILPSPVPRMIPSLILMGMITFSLDLADIAPLRSIGAPNAWMISSELST